MSKGRIAVIAKHKAEFDDFLRPWVGENDYHKFVCVSHVSDVSHHKFREVISIGGIEVWENYINLIAAVKSKMEV